MGTVDCCMANNKDCRALNQWTFHACNLYSVDDEAANVIMDRPMVVVVIS